MSANVDRLDRESHEIDIVDVEHQDSPLYGGPGVEGEPYYMELIDNRKSQGALAVDVMPVSSDTDDLLSVTVDISSLEGVEAQVPRVVLHIGETHELSIYKINNKLVLVPGNGGQNIKPAGDGQYFLI